MISSKNQRTTCSQGNVQGDSFLNNTFEIGCDDDFIIISVPMYKFFISHGKDGLEAKQLYDHILFASRVQGTKAVRANQSYIKNGLGWGRDKVKKAKAFLSAAGLIEYVQIKDDSGQFKDQRIILKNSWNTNSLMKWVDRKKNSESERNTGGLVSRPSVDTVESPIGLNSSPMEDIAAYEDDTPPDSGGTDLPAVGQTRPPVSAPNYKGSYKKEKGGGYNSRVITTGNRGSESEESSDSLSPPDSLSEENRGLFSEAQEKIRQIVGSKFNLSGKSRDMIREFYKLTSSHYILLIVDMLIVEKQGRTKPWLDRYANQDLQERLAWGMRTQPAKQQQTDIHQIFCPCCNSVYLGTNTSCSSCGFDKQDIDNSEKIKEHAMWLSSKDEVSPFKLDGDEIHIQIENFSNNLSVEIQIYDFESHIELEQGLKPGREVVLQAWQQILQEVEHWGRHTEGFQPSIALMYLRAHIKSLDGLTEEAFTPNYDLSASLNGVG